MQCLLLLQHVIGDKPQKSTIRNNLWYSKLNTWPKLKGRAITNRQFTQEELKKAPTSLLLPQQKSETMLRKGYKRIQDIMDDDTSDPFHPNYKPFKKLKKATGPLGLCESKFQLFATALPNRTVLPQFMTKKNTKRQIHETFEMDRGSLIPGHYYLQPKKGTQTQPHKVGKISL